MALPVTPTPEAKTVHFFAIIAKGRVPIWITLQVKLDQLLQICTDDLIGIDENDLIG